MELTVREILSNAIDEMQRAKEMILYLQEECGDRLITGDSLTDIEILIEDMNKSIERLTTIENTAVHKETIRIPVEEFDRINRLLAIESLEEMTDSELIEQCANTDYHEGIFYVQFDNGASINFDLCSGSHNYWDDVVWTSPDGNRDVVLDCEYELDDIEVEIDSELYIVKIIKE